MSALQRLTAEPSLLALHLAILPQHSDWQAVDAEVLASAREKLAASAQSDAVDACRSHGVAVRSALPRGSGRGTRSSEAARIGAVTEPLPAAA